MEQRGSKLELSDTGSPANRTSRDESGDVCFVMLEETLDLEQEHHPSEWDESKNSEIDDALDSINVR